MVVRGHVQNGVIVLDEGVQLPEGQQVTVVTSDVSSQVKDEPDERRDAALSLIGILKPEQPPASPLYQISPEKRDAILSLIGIWKTDSPPNDEEVERIIDEYRTQKYG